MAFRLSAYSKGNLTGVHRDLVRVVELAITRTGVDFRVIEGLRSKARQKRLVASGASKTMNSRHITGHAVDLCALDDGEVSWHLPLYDRIADAMLLAAAELGVPVIWGGTWKAAVSPHAPFCDGPHFELDRDAYP